MRQQLLEYTLCGVLIGMLSLVAFIALSFLWSQYNASTDTTSRLAAIMFAPFALLAALVPAFAVPMVRKVGGAMRLRINNATLIQFVLCFFVTWLATEATLLTIRTLGRAETALPWPFHVLLAGYAIAGAFLARDRTSNENPSIPS